MPTALGVATGVPFRRVVTEDPNIPQDGLLVDHRGLNDGETLQPSTGAGDFTPKQSADLVFDGVGVAPSLLAIKGSVTGSSYLGLRFGRGLLTGSGASTLITCGPLSLAGFGFSSIGPAGATDSGFACGSAL